MLDPKNLDEFARKAIASEVPFSIEHEERYPDWYIPAVYGSAKLIYACRMYSGPEDAMPGDMAELVAVVANQVVYLDGIFGLNALPILPKGVVPLQAFSQKLDDAAMGLIHEYYDKLEPARASDLPDHRFYSLERDARKCVLGITPLAGLSAGAFRDKPFNARTTLAVLSGTTDVPAVAKEYCQSHAKTMAEIKCYAEAVGKRMVDPKLTEPWEIELAKSLASLKALSVTVEFSKNGKTAAGKIARTKVLDILANRGYFSSWEFEVASKGQAIIDELCPVVNDYQQPLRCSDISRIIFQRKVLYERPDDAAEKQES